MSHPPRDARCHPRREVGRSTPEPFGPKHVRLGVAIAEIPGHFRAALDLYASGDAHGALMHVKHALIEVLPVVHEELGEDHPLVGRLSRALAVAGASIRDQKAPTIVNESFEDANEAGAKAIAAFVGDAASLPAYRASVVAALLDSAATDYSEALSINEARRVFEYQDTRGFLLQAKRMLETLPPAPEINDHFERLEGMVPSLELPSDPVPISEVRGEVDELRSLLATTAGATLDADPTVTEVLEKIEHLVRRVADHYRDGQGPRAAREAARAFVNHYGAIAEDVRRRDAATARELEQLLGRDLRIQINAGAPSEEVDEGASRVLALLAVLGDNG